MENGLRGTVGIGANNPEVITAIRAADSGGLDKASSSENAEKRLASVCMYTKGGTMGSAGCLV